MRERAGPKITIYFFYFFFVENKTTEASLKFFNKTIIPLNYLLVFA